MSLHAQASTATGTLPCPCCGNYYCGRFYGGICPAMTAAAAPPINWQEFMTAPVFQMSPQLITEPRDPMKAMG